MTSMILADGTMGQMMEPVSLDFAEGEKVEKPWATTGTKMEREHNIVNSLFLSPEKLEKTNFERFERYKKIEETEALYEEFMTDDADIVLVAFGIASRVSKNACIEARKMGIKVGLIRPITLWPFPQAPFIKTVDNAKAYISVELSMGQMIDDVKLATNCKKPVYLCNRTGGMIVSPEEVLEKIIAVNKECAK